MACAHLRWYTGAALGVLMLSTAALAACQSEVADEVTVRRTDGVLTLDFARHCPVRQLTLRPLAAIGQPIGDEPWWQIRATEGAPEVATLEVGPTVAGFEVTTDHTAEDAAPLLALTVRHELLFGATIDVRDLGDGASRTYRLAPVMTETLPNPRRC
ncbi:hypothetical protein [Micromonospora zamorensis]|uniref:hypothetical protein n=1 Tax=Micromonospora zamorensis TaxID=709883 RepID=UPI002ED0547B|nr:hypothetical protein OG886_32200 [Micromonospora zamorensis]